MPFGPNIQASRIIGLTISGNGVTASGTAGYIAVYDGSNTLGTGVIYNIGSYVGINTTNSTASLHIISNDNTANNLAFRVDDSNGSPLFSIRNDRRIVVGYDNLSLSNTFGHTFASPVDTTLAFVVGSNDLNNSFLELGNDGSFQLGYLAGPSHIFAGNGSDVFYMAGNYQQFGINEINPSAALHIVGFDHTSSNYSLIIQNDIIETLFSVRNDGYISAGENGGSNLTIGISTGFNLAYTNNTFIGVGISPNISGNYNTFVGAAAASVATGASRNTAFGNGALAGLSIGFGNAALGWNAGAGITSNTYEVAIGMGALGTLHTGQNVAIGSGPYGGALGNLNGSGNNTAVGNMAGWNMGPVDGNTLIGDQAMGRNSTGNNNTVLGAAAGNFAIGSASNNVYIGYGAGYQNNNDPAGSPTDGCYNNIFIGSGSGQSSKSSNSVFIGYESGSNELRDNQFILSNNLGNLITGNFASGSIYIPGSSGQNSGATRLAVDTYNNNGGSGNIGLHVRGNIDDSSDIIALFEHTNTFGGSPTTTSSILRVIGGEHGATVSAFDISSGGFATIGDIWDGSNYRLKSVMTDINTWDYGNTDFYNTYIENSKGVYGSFTNKYGLYINSSGYFTPQFNNTYNYGLYVNVNSGTGSGTSYAASFNGGKIIYNDGSQAAGYVLVSDANGVASWTSSTSGGSILKTKSDSIPGASFSGITSLTYSVSFITPYISTDYSIQITGQDSRSFTYINKTTNGFIIDTNSTTPLTGDVDYITTAHGEN
jgi:hypothetical protein